MKPTTFLIAFLVTVVISLPLLYLNMKQVNEYDKVTQSVEENSHEFHGYETIDFLIPYEKPEKYDSIVKERQRRMEAPYVLITSYEYEIVYDFGDYKYIDSIKCIRFSEMKKRAKEIERENAIERYKAKKRELELEKLNKPCR